MLLFASDFNPIIFLSFIAVVGIVIFVSIYFSDRNRILRALKKVRRKPIHSVRNNEYVKIIGKAKHAGEPLIAPLSGRKCVYYHVVVEKKSGKHWRRIINDIHYEDFFINDGNEMAILQLRAQTDTSRRIHLVTDHKANSDAFNSADENLERYLKEHGQSSTGVFGFNKTIKYRESIIELNESIAVMGIGKWKEIDVPVDGYSSSRVLTLTGTKEQKLLVTDEPKALVRVARKL